MLLAVGVAVAAPVAHAGDHADPELYLAATLMRVVDGDTIQVRLDSGPIRIRLYGIDAPETGQPLGSAARKLLRSELEGEPLEIEPIEQRDTYGRMVAKVLVRGDDISARMVESGYAWAYRKYLRHRTDDERYCRLEAEARAAGRGVWTGAPRDWRPPWDSPNRRHGKPAAGVSYAGETAERCIAAIGLEGPFIAGERGRTDSAPGTGCDIKGNINATGQRIYHVPDSSSYASTRINTAKGERWFCSVEEAERAGWRSPRH